MICWMALLDGVKASILCMRVDRLFGWTKALVVTPSTCEGKYSLLTHLSLTHGLIRWQAIFSVYSQ